VAPVHNARRLHSLVPRPLCPSLAYHVATVRRLLTVLIAIPLVIWLRQCRKPRGVLGAIVVRAFNVGHAHLTDWGLSHVTIKPADVCLDVGCGGGRTVQHLAALTPEGRVCGVDYSDACVTASRRANALAVAAGRVKIELASVAALPFPDRAFDLVTAVETHYYWPDLEANLREILRVLKPGGTLALIAETVRDRQWNPLYFIVMPLLGAAHLTTAQHEAVLTRAGFTNVVVQTRKNGWMCATGRRPA